MLTDPLKSAIHFGTSSKNADATTRHAKAQRVKSDLSSQLILPNIKTQNVDEFSSQSSPKVSPSRSNSDPPITKSRFPIHLLKRTSFPIPQAKPTSMGLVETFGKRDEASYITAQQIDEGLQRIAKLASSPKQTQKIAEILEALKCDATLSFQQQAELYQSLQTHLSSIRKTLRFHQLKSATATLEPYLRHFKPRSAKFSKDGSSQVRSESELSPSDIKIALKQDMYTITPAYLHQVFDNVSPDIDPALARHVLQYMIQWGHPDALTGLMEALSDPQNNKAFAGRRLVPSGNAALSDTLRYLVGNSSKPKPLLQYDRLFAPQKGSFNDLDTNSLILLDKPVLQRLQDDKEFFNKIIDRKNNHFLIVPRGWDAGANLFSIHDPKQVGKRLKSLCREVQRNEAEGMPREIAIKEALEKPVLDQLAQAFKKHAPEYFEKCKTDNKLCDSGTIKQVLGPKRIQFIDSNRFNPIQDPSLDDLRAQWKQGPRLKKKDIQRLLEKLPKDQRQPFLELLGQGLQVFTPRRMSIEFQKLHQRILKLAQEKGIDESQIYFYIPQSASSNKVSVKSHTLVTNQYCEVNNIPYNRLISSYNQFPETGKAMIVVLDDFSGSGHSLAAVAKRIQEFEPTGRNGQLQVVIAPNVASEETLKLLTRGGEFNMARQMNRSQKQAGNSRQGWISRREHYAPSPFITVMPGIISPNLRTTPYYKKLSPQQIRLFDDLMGQNGYMDCSTFTGFWWMSPTNNIRSEIAKQVLELNLLNKTGYR